MSTVIEIRKWFCSSCGIVVFGGNPEYCDLCDVECGNPLCCDCYESDHGASHEGDLDTEVEL
jgi:hypothetical protein